MGVSVVNVGGTFENLRKKKLAMNKRVEEERAR